jgi:hypothetical protein
MLYNNSNRTVYTTIISTNKIDTNVPTFIYLAKAKAFATRFDLYKAIVRRIYKNLPDDDHVKVETCSERLCLINEC